MHRRQAELNWVASYIAYQDSLPVFQRSPYHVITGPGGDYFVDGDQHANHYANARGNVMSSQKKPRNYLVSRI